MKLITLVELDSRISNAYAKVIGTIYRVENTKGPLSRGVATAFRMGVENCMRIPILIGGDNPEWSISVHVVTEFLHDIAEEYHSTAYRTAPLSGKLSQQAVYMLDAYEELQALKQAIENTISNSKEA